MTGSSVQAVGEVARCLGELTPQNTSEKAIYGLLVGAIYALRRALQVGYMDRTGDLLPTDYGEEVVRVARGLATSGEVIERPWLAGFYFNSCLLRLAPVCERLCQYILERQDLIPNARKEANRIKHDIDGLLGGREVGPAAALDAASILTTAISRAFGQE